MRIVFMGTPGFAVPSLQALLDNGFDVVAAVTQPDRPSGRGKKLTMCPVKEVAIEHCPACLQFEKIRSTEGVDALKALEPDLFVTAAFGQILSQEVLDIPRLGTVNVHASLLPKYRGAAPINQAIIAGEAFTGITTMMTDKGIDTGDILMQREVEILPEETAGELTLRLAEAGANLLVETLRKIEEDTCPRVPQDASLASYQPMLQKEDGRLDWTQGAAQLFNRVRGVSPWPGAFTTLPDGGILKIWKSRPTKGSGAPGEILYADGKRGMAVACGDGALEILELQAPNAKRMPAADYLRGKPMQPGTILGKESN